MNTSFKTIMVVAVSLGNLGMANLMADPGFHGRDHRYHSKNDGPSLQRISLTLHRQSQGLVNDIDSHFGNHPRYRHLLNDAQDLANHANHARLMVVNQKSRAHVGRDLDQMTELAEHLYDLLDGMVRRTRHSVVRQIEWNQFGHGINIQTGRMDRDTLLHLRDRVQSIRVTLAQMNVEFVDYYPAVDRVMDAHHPSNRGAVEVRPLVIPSRSSGVNFQLRIR